MNNPRLSASSSLNLTTKLLDEKFKSVPYEIRLRRLYDLYDPTEVLVTSSFGTNSVFLLWLLSRIRPDQKIHFINTTYHFPETLAYKKQLEDLFDLKIVEILPDSAQNQLSAQQAWWKTDIERCCAVNKIAPLAPLKAQHKVWVSGVAAYQTALRKGLKLWEQQDNLLKFHPLLDVDEGEFLYQTGLHKLPQHPLKAAGYGSVGCTHCTKKGTGRAGRWVNKEKTECGLHYA